MPGNDDLFELTREQIDELPFGVVTLDRRGIVLRYNRAEADLSARSAAATIGLDFFSDVAPCTNVKAFRGRFDAFAQANSPGAECFDFSFAFRWGRHDVSITLLRKAGRHEINIIVRGRSVATPKRAVGQASDPDDRIPAHGAGAAPMLGGRGVVRLAEPTLCPLGGSEEADLRRRIHSDDIAAVERVAATAAAERRAYAMEYRTVRPDRSIAVVQETGWFGRDGAVAGQAAIVDVSARRRREEDTWRAAHYDELTGLPNRRYFSQRVGDALREIGHTSEIAAVLILNVDKFREINDLFGREIGNRLLQMLAQRIGEFIRAGDSAAYLGLDMFGVLLTAVENEAFVTSIAQRLLNGVAQPFIIDEQPFTLTARIGMNAAAAHEGNAATLVRGAYTAMNTAQGSGSCRHAWYSSTMTADAADAGRRRNELHAVLENDELTLYYQPIIDTARDRVVAVEALARWNHPTRGVLPPAEFIDLADETGFIVFLGEWVLREACRQGREWSELGFDVRVCVNVSVVQFRQPDFVALVAAILAQSGLAPDGLEIEITESVMIEGFAEVVERLSRLKALGVRLAIDDFGTGYSSLAYLKYFPVDTLKIDRAFVTDIAVDVLDRAIAKSVLTLADELGLDCVVEGVENAEQRDVLSAIGCTIMQGYHFCKPMPPAQLTPLLSGAARAGPLLHG